MKSNFKSTKKSSHLKALSSKRPKEIWVVQMHRILIRVKDVNCLTMKYEIIIAQLWLKILQRQHLRTNEIIKLINPFSSSPYQDQFYLRKGNCNQILHEMKFIHSDCSIGTNNIPINLTKIAGEEVIYSSIEHFIFPSR